jgi:hypothetical protein
MLDKEACRRTGHILIEKDLQQPRPAASWAGRLRGTSPLPPSTFRFQPSVLL